MLLAFGIGWQEVLIVLGIVMLLFGGKRIPELARSFGQSIVEFKKGAKGIDEEEPGKEPQSPTARDPQ